MKKKKDNFCKVRNSTCKGIFLVFTPCTTFEKENSITPCRLNYKLEPQTWPTIFVSGNKYGQHKSKRSLTFCIGELALSFFLK